LKGSGSTSHQAKIVQKTLISIVFFLLLYVFLSLKKEVNVPSKSNPQKNIGGKIIFCLHLEGH
jgi:hypothetical protein